MSTDTLVFFDTDGVDTGALVTQLRAGVPAIRAVEERYRNQWRVEHWHRPEGTPDLLGPGGFHLRVSSRLVTLYHLTRFSSFTHDDEARALLLTACRSLAVLLGATRMLVTHEMMPAEGLSLDDVAASLQSAIGPPAPDLAALQAAQHFGAHAWWLCELTASP